MRFLLTFVFFIQSVTLPFAYADGGPSVSSRAREIPCLAIYYESESTANLDARDWLNNRRTEAGTVDIITADLCPDLEAYLETRTEAGACTDGRCDDVVPAATEDTDRSGIDKDFVDTVDEGGPAPSSPSPQPTHRPRTASHSGGFMSSLGAFFSNPIVTGVIGLGLGYLWGRKSARRQYMSGQYQGTGQFYPPRFVPPYYMNGSQYPYGLRPIPGYNYGSLLNGGQVYNGAGYNQGGFNGGWGGQGGQGGWGGQGGQGGNIYNGGYAPPILPYQYQ